VSADSLVIQVGARAIAVFGSHQELQVVFTIGLGRY